jgi:hypothetical protein
MKIIAFGYKKGSGKDTAGKFLDIMLRASNVKSCRASFADKLKDIAFQLYGWSGLKRGIYYETHRDHKELILPDLGLSPRDIWIQVGNKMREVYPDTWIDYVLNGRTCDIIIVTDLRFQNEAEILLKNDATLVRMSRTGIELGTDPAEVDLDGWDRWHYDILNDGTMNDLNSRIKAMAVDLKLLEK